MEWFSQWWSSMDLFTQILYCVSIPSTLILIIQTILILIGFGNGGPDFNPSDTSGFDIHDPSCGCDVCDPTDFPDMAGHDGGDVINPADAGAMHLFTFQGIITFLCVFSWVGILSYMGTKNIFIAILIGFICGAAAMYGVAKIIQISSKLTQNGNIVAKNYLGETATVYFPIPANCEGQGRINISVGERCAEFKAITEDDEIIPSGARVRIVDVMAEDVMVVERS